MNGPERDEYRLGAAERQRLVDDLRLRRAMSSWLGELLPPSEQDSEELMAVWEEGFDACACHSAVVLNRLA